MRVTFICSSLEPGCDGVGDYTRMLADSLVRQGHNAQLIALHDRHANGRANSVPYAVDADGESRAAATTRIAATTPWSARVSRIRPAIERFDPDWISLQFVAYGFDDRGFVWRLGDRLRALDRSTPIHLMFHELWVGDGQGSSHKRRLQGRLQKYLIREMVRRLRPSVVHAQASPYVAMLRQNGIAATRLPLFGNVPVSASTDRGWVYDAFLQAGLPTAPERRRHLWVFGLFGTLHPEWTPEPLLSRIGEAAAFHHKQPVLMAIGRLGPAGDRIWSNLGRSQTGIAHVRIGEQPPDRISQALQELDFGIAASPLALIGKSSTVATMLDHGLPVIVSRNDVVFPVQWDDVETRDPLLIPLGEDLCERLPSMRRRPARHTVDVVSQQFLASLEASTR